MTETAATETAASGGLPVRGFTADDAAVHDKARRWLVGVAPTTALISAGVYFLNQVVLFAIFTTVLSDPANNRLAPLFQSIDGLTLAAVWLGLIPVILATYRLRTRPIGVDKAASAIGITGATVLALLMLRIGFTASSETVPTGLVQLAALLIGAWMILVNSRSSITRAFSAGLAGLGILVGIAVTLRELIGSDFGSGLIPITNIVGYVGLPVWLILLSRRLARREPVSPPAVSVAVVEGNDNSEVQGWPRAPAWPGRTTSRASGTSL